MSRRVGKEWGPSPRSGVAVPLLSGGLLVLAVLAAVNLPPSHPPPGRLNGISQPGAGSAARSPIAWHHVEDFDRPLAQFPTVFWEPRDTESLRQLIRDTPLVHGKQVLEIGTGTGLIALCCLQAGARAVVATDVNPAALANARYNAATLGLAARLETRLVPLDRAGAFSAVRPNERFDVIVSNPPWEDGRPAKIDDYAFYDEGFRLMQSLLEGLPDHLAPDGRCLLAYGCVSAIRRLTRDAVERGLQARALDDRPLDQLPEMFLPGMLIEVGYGAGRSHSR